MKRYEVSYAVNTVDGKTVTVGISATGFMFTDTHLIFQDGDGMAVLAVPLSREPVVLAVAAP